LLSSAAPLGRFAPSLQLARRAALPSKDQQGVVSAPLLNTDTAPSLIL